MNLFESYKKIIVDGDKISSEKDFVDILVKLLEIKGKNFNLIPEVKDNLKSQKEKIIITWINPSASKKLMVRKSDVPFEELPEGGSLMQREIILELIWEKQSLFDKAKIVLKDLKNVKIKTRSYLFPFLPLW